MSYYEMAKTAAEYILSKCPKAPELVLVLGSGLGDYAEQIENPTIIPYPDIPGFKTSTVKGHAGRLVIGELFGVNVAIMQGRIHYYEGYTQQEITLPIRSLKLCGANTVLFTNASGGIDRSFVPGDLMMIDDHINLSGKSPLMGPNEDEFGHRFPDMAKAYDKELKQVLLDAAQKANVDLKRGVYIMFNGPQFETGAEINFARIIGAHAVGMSTVPEVIAARHAGMRIAAVSCITNMAAGILDQPITHSEVNETAAKAKVKFTALVNEFVKGVADLV